MNSASPTGAASRWATAPRPTWPRAGREAVTAVMASAQGQGRRRRWRTDGPAVAVEAAGGRRGERHRGQVTPGQPARPSVALAGRNAGVEPLGADDHDDVHVAATELGVGDDGRQAGPAGPHER